MAITIIDPLLNEGGSNDDLSRELAEAKGAAAERALPEKYRGKSIEDVIEMHRQAESTIGRQGAELGELRRVTDQLIKRPIEREEAPAKPAEKQEVTPVDFYADPNAAIERAVAASPRVQELEKSVEQVRREKGTAALLNKHPDAPTISQSPEFQEWVQKSKVRQRLFVAAAQDWDIDAADELLDTFKALNPTKFAKSEQGAEGQAETQAQTPAPAAQSRGATTPRGTVPTENNGDGKKIYRRADLIRLRQTDPARYMELQPEIMAAYAEKRVR